MANILKVLKFHIIVLSTLFASSICHAKDFGTNGEVFTISEKDPVKLIESKLKKLEESGEIANLQKKWKENAANSIKRPKDARDNISKTSEDSIRYYDPTITIDSDISDHQGKVFARKGQKINPFDHIDHYYPYLIFIDGDDEQQFKFAISLFKEQSTKNLNPKIILLRGDIIDLMDKAKIRLFFDQKGFLSDKFGIDKVPSIVEREGRRLKIQEVAL